MVPRKVWIGLATFGIAIWIIYPGNDLAINLETCKPSGMIEKIGSRVFPTQFWEGQEEAIADGIAGYWETKRRRAETEREIETVLRDHNQIMEEHYAKHPEDRPHPSRADRLREVADEIEHREMMAVVEQFEKMRLQQLEHCQAVVAGRGRFG